MFWKRMEIEVRRFASLSDPQLMLVAENWACIRVMKGCTLRPDRIINCMFSGRILLGDFSEKVTFDDLVLPSGLIQSTLHNCILSSNSLVMNTTLLTQSYIGQRAVVFGCGVISFGSSKLSSFANDLQLPVGVEIGGRDIACFADISFECTHRLTRYRMILTFLVAAEIGRNRQSKDVLQAHKDKVKAFATRATSSMNIICQDARVINCSKISQVYIGPHGRVQTGQVIRSSVLSSQDEPTVVEGQAIVQNSIIQWGSHVDTMAIVQDSFMCDHSHVSMHGKLLSSFLGPNSGISEGECTSCFVGPFVGFHHQALLIASFWPEGKGNVGYGANVGSNHTLKAPDQELWPGEGVFFGLGTNIKFPSNFTQAPYSVIATGVMTLPQKVDMPFSLINGASISTQQLSPAINEIMPGWVLGSSIFTLLRNESKFQTRNKSKRTVIDHRIFRPEIIDMMKHARETLVRAEGKAAFTFKKIQIFTDRQVAGLGKNYMTESSRVAGIKAYTFFLRHYVFIHIVERLEQTGGIQISDQHVNTIMTEEFGSNNVAGILPQAAESFRRVAEQAEKGKARDDKRGMRIIPDYKAVHKEASDEEIVKQAKKRADQVAHLVKTQQSRL